MMSDSPSAYRYFRTLRILSAPVTHALQKRRNKKTHNFPRTMQQDEKKHAACCLALFPDILIPFMNEPYKEFGSALDFFIKLFSP